MQNMSHRLASLQLLKYLSSGYPYLKDFQHTEPKMR